MALQKKKKEKKESPQVAFLRKQREKDWEELSKTWKKNEGNKWD